MAETSRKEIGSIREGPGSGEGGGSSSWWDASALWGWSGSILRWGEPSSDRSAPPKSAWPVWSAEASSLIVNSLFYSQKDDSDSSSSSSFVRRAIEYASDESMSRLESLLSTLYVPSNALNATSAPGAAAETAPTEAVAPRALFLRGSHPKIRWLLRNPYDSVRGAYEPFGSHGSVSAVRSLLALAPALSSETLHQTRLDIQNQKHHSNIQNHSTLVEPADSSILRQSPAAVLHPPPPPPTTTTTTAASSHTRHHQPSSTQPIQPPSSSSSRINNAQIASRLALGTLRALRDLALDEATQLHSSLRFWTDRWERPLLSWLEAGPMVWFSEAGYNHQVVCGRKVSQIQAVLARRCASIGELQSHLLRAGWERGVAQWGVLGQGGQWAPVAGGDGAMDEQLMAGDTSNSWPPYMGSSTRLPRNNLLEGQRQPHLDYYDHTSIFVKNTHGGHILIDDAALAAWTVDAIRVVRNQLYKAARNGIDDDNAHFFDIRLPYAEHWPQEMDHDYRVRPSPGNMILPLWATTELSQDAGGTRTDQDSQILTQRRLIVITDLSLMAAEVSQLLNAMELLMEKQRNRRLNQLRPPTRWQRQWYVGAVVAPIGGFVIYNLFQKDFWSSVRKRVVDQIVTFYFDHISEPLWSIYRELWKGRENVTDRRARLDAITALKNMIKSWLDETYPAMSESERKSRADAMDFSLIEAKKEDSIKNLFELNHIIRMSLIEMQFIKKEMMNAMYAMDELMGSNEINMQLAAMTPAFVIVYVVRGFFRFLFYALLKIRKSREETYESFRRVILDIERLLVMRDDPPDAPSPLSFGALYNSCEQRRENESIVKASGDDAIDSNQASSSSSSSSSLLVGPTMKHSIVLNTDDIGMLMLLVHECRIILWQNRRRFSARECLDLSEDLAELAGERGAVSVRQQLQIVARMCRTYSFLKVVSAALPFRLIR